MDEQRRRVPPVRARSVRLLSVLLALGLLYFPGLGIVDLAAAIFGLPDQGDFVSMRIGYGLVIGFLLPVALLALVRKPILAAAPVQQVFAVALAFFVAAVAGTIWSALVGGTGLLVAALVLARLAPGPLHLWPLANSAYRPLVVLAILGAGPWLAYAATMSARQRVGSAPYEDFTLGVQGWSALTVFAVVMVLNSLIMTLRPPGWRSMAWATGVASSAFGLVGILAEAAPGSPGQVWGAGAVVWGVGLVVSSSLGRAAQPTVPEQFCE